MSTSPPRSPIRDLTAELRSETYSVLDRQGGRVVFTGRKLAQTSSQRNEHLHPGVEFAPPRYQCSGCRWFRPTLWVVDTSSGVSWQTGDDHSNETRYDPPTELRRYVLQTSGMSRVPGETERSAVSLHVDAASVVRALIVTSRSPQPYLPEASVELLSRVSELDPWFDAVYDTLVDPLDRHR